MFKNDVTQPRKISVSCGRCTECLRSQSATWAVRVMLEARSHAENCFVTLTYDNDYLPPDGQLCRRHVQLFLKSLRKSIAPKKIRMFYSGEYGSLHGRPHYHIIIFGWRPPDLVSFRDNKNDLFYTSAFVSKLWKRGYISVGDLSYKSALYCAKYMQKIASADMPVKSFIGMSNRPGIGYNAVDPYMLNGKLYYDGKSMPVPRYFIRVLEHQGYDVTDLKLQRMRLQQLNARMSDLSDITARRKKSEEFLKKG